jgi:hypothetical protein
MIIPMSKVENRPSVADDTAVEPQRVRRWRREQFHELGFTLSEAYLLADTLVDLGDARRLIAAGCPRTTAARILV